MNTDKILTAKEFLNSKNYWHSEDYIPLLQKFAKLHVKAALEAASKKAELKIDFSMSELPEGKINKDSILNAYPEDLIK